MLKALRGGRLFGDVKRKAKHSSRSVESSPSARATLGWRGESRPRKTWAERLYDDTKMLRLQPAQDVTCFVLVGYI